LTKRRLLQHAWLRHTSWMGSESKSRGQSRAKRVVHLGVPRWAVRVVDAAATTTVVVEEDLEDRRITAGVAAAEVTVTAAVHRPAMDTAAAALMAPPLMPAHTVVVAAPHTVVGMEPLPKVKVGMVTVTPRVEEDVLSPPPPSEDTEDTLLLRLQADSSMPHQRHLRVGMEVPGAVEQARAMLNNLAHTAMLHEEQRGVQNDTVHTD